MRPTYLHDTKKGIFMIRISNQLIALSLLITSSLAIAMNKNPIHQEITIKELTAIEKPTRVAFLRNKNTAMMANENGVYEVDCKKDEKIADMVTGYYPMFCFPNQQRDAVALFNLQKVKLYDVNKKTISWERPVTFKNNFPPSCAFTRRCLYLIETDGTVYNNLGQTYNIPEASTQGWKGIITTDSIKDKVVFTKYVDESTSALCTINFDEEPVTVTRNGTLANKPWDFPNAQCRSLISKLIAICYPLTCIWNIYNETDKAVTDVPNCCLLTFHPTKQHLAILTKDGFVEIRDILKQTIIAKTNESLGTPKLATAANERVIDFSEDGENLAVIVNEKCFVLSNLYSANDK